MKNKKLGKIDKFLKSGIFDTELVKIGSVIGSLKDKIKERRRIHILYGETCDEYGLTIDSLKYYFILHILHKLLEELGARVKSEIMIGDVASIRNENVKNKEKIVNSCRARFGLLSGIVSKYELRFTPVLMSEVFKKPLFLRRFENISRLVQEDTKIKKMVQKTILRNRIRQEESAKYRYSCEEIALIMDYDFKIGPPREVYYDEIAKKMKQDFLGIYVKPTYPFGQGFDYFVNSPEIEKFGLTPYKAGSNKMQDSRIIIGKTSLGKLKSLVRDTFIPDDLDLPNPLRDLCIIADLFRRVQIDDYDFNLNYQDKEIDTDLTLSLIEPLLNL
ncbi:MAG: hypothetical protein PHS44_02955 [Candidatus Dojkabacteria bacterium]|nr:hypothetical protein [Candidatus Dojkabacteria bacterium]